MTIARLIKALAKVRSGDELTQALATFSSAMGFSQFRLTVIIPDSLQHPLVVFFSDCSKEWAVRYNQEHMLERDPVIHLALRQTLPFHWQTSIPGTSDLPLGSLEVMALRRQNGLNDGISFPLRGAHGELGVMSFITSDDGLAKLRSASPVLRLAADYAFDAAVRVVQLHGHRPSLTKREVECLWWGSEGKTSSEIAEILRVSTRTVTFHVEHAVAKTKSANRDQAIAKAALSGLLMPRLDEAIVEEYLQVGPVAPPVPPGKEKPR
jgi:LuxR family transcriptional activator of bioluminescence operon